MKKMRILDSTGDSVIEWDDSQELADKKAEAQEAFDKAMKAAGFAFDVTHKSEGRSEIIRDFSKLGDETILVPRAIVAG